MSDLKAKQTISSNNFINYKAEGNFIPPPSVMSAYLAGARLAITGERHRPSALEALNGAATPNLSNNITISNYQRSINIANCISGIRILSKLASELTREGTLH